MLPFPSAYSVESDVVLQQGDKAYLIKGFSPIGTSFRDNKCTGYFEENEPSLFTPGLPTECPLPKDEKLPVFSNNTDSENACLDAIDRVYQCNTVSSEFIRDLPDTVTQNCKDYLENQINYNSCVALHFSDTDFPGNQYWIYLDKLNPLWNLRHDTINLYDENNLVVDTISY